MNVNEINRLTKGIALGAFALFLCTATAPVAQAQNYADRSTFTESQPFEVGTTRLEPGTYLIRIVMLSSNRSVLQVTDPKEMKVYASVVAVPHPIRAEETVPSSRYTYYPSVAGHPKALRTWFSTDSRLGHDIAYPKRRAQELAAVVHEPVLAVPEQVTEVEYKTVEIETVKPEAKPEAKPAPEPVLVAEARPAKPLPATASELPLFGALGLLSLAGALALRLTRKA